MLPGLYCLGFFESASSAVSIVQFGQLMANNNTDDVAMPATPTTGNWLVAIGIFSSFSSVPTNSGWTTIVNHNDGDTAGGHSIRMAYRQVQAGDTATVVPFAEGDGTQKYIGVWELAPNDPGAAWADFFGATRTNRGNGTQQNSDYALDAGDNYLVLFGATLRGSSSATPTSTGWTLTVNGTSVGLNRRYTFGRKSFPSGAIDMTTLVCNPAISAGLGSIALRAA